MGRLVDSEPSQDRPSVFPEECGKFSAPKSRWSLGSAKGNQRICVDRGEEMFFLAGFFLALHYLVHKARWHNNNTFLSLAPMVLSKLCRR